MGLDFSYKNVEWCQTSFYKSDDCICDANLIVPDSQSDIAKVISIKGYSSVTDCKAEDGRIVITGQVKFNVLYIGEDDTSKVYTITSSFPFSHTVSASVTPDTVTLCSVTGCTLEHTLVNSRKIKATAFIKLCIHAYKNNRAQILVSAPAAETKTKDATFFAAKVLCSKNIPLSENLDLPQGKGAITKILRYTPKISDYEYKVLNNKAIIKGNISLCVLYLSEDNITDALVTFPFTEVVEAEGLSSNFDTSVSLSVSDCEVLSDTDLSGEYKMLDVNLLLLATITSFATEKITAVTDIYYPKGAVKTENCNIPLQQQLPACSEEEFIKETVTLNKTAPSIVKVFDIDCAFTDLSFKDSVLSAVAEVTIFYSSLNSPVNAYTTRIPLSHKFGENSGKTFSVELKHSGYALTGDNSIELRLGVKFNLSCTREENITLFTLCEEADYTPSKRASIVVSFVGEGDSLWDIAKRYNIALSSLAAANALDENAILTVGEKLIIPR